VKSAKPRSARSVTWIVSELEWKYSWSFGLVPLAISFLL